MEPFKNNISPDLVRCIGGHVAQHHADFDRLGFEADILEELDSWNSSSVLR